MTKRVTLLIIALVVVMACSGCGLQYTTRVRPPQGLLFCQFKAPLTIDMDNTQAGAQMTRVSQSSTYYFRDFIFTGMDFSWGEVDFDTLAKMGGLKEIYFADYELLNVLGIYAQFTIHLYGAAQ